MADGGYFADLETKLLHLVGVLRCAVQVDLDVGLHTRGMTPSEAMDELVKRVPVTRRQAELDIRRYCETPALALAEAVGRRALGGLRTRHVRSAAPISPCAFHDEVLSYGGLPVSLIRWGMGID